MRSHSSHSLLSALMPVVIAAAFPHAQAATSAMARSASAAASTATEAELIVGKAVTLPWRPASITAYRLRLQAGDFVQGSLAGPAATLDLTDHNGKHVRRLLGSNTLSRSFLFVLPSGGWYRFVVDTRGADRPGSVGRVPSAQGADAKDAAVATQTLRIDRVVPRAAQQSPQPPAESPAQSSAQPSTPAHKPSPAQPSTASEPESPRLRQLAAELARGGNTTAFWQRIAREGTPLIEPLPSLSELTERSDLFERSDGDQPSKGNRRRSAAAASPQTQMVLATFLWRGAERGVRLLGSPAGDHDDLYRLGDSDVLYRSYRIPASTRLSYQLAPDVPALDAEPMQRRRAILATAQRDPLNPRAFPADGIDVFQQKSVLELSAAPPQPWIARHAGVPAGTVTRHRIESRLLGETREVYLYQPAPAQPGSSETPGGNDALLVVFDAHAYLTLVPTPTILDNLMHDGLLPRTAALIVANPDAQARATQLPPNPAFADFLAQELLPWAQSRGVRAAAASTVVAGSSYGGIAAAYAGLRHPERFGLVLSQSGSYWWAPGASPAAPPDQAGWLIREYAAAPKLPLRFYLEAGLFEQGRGAVDIFHTTRDMRDVLRAKGYPVAHAEFASGHDYLQWRGTLACGLMALIGTEKARAGLRAGGGLARACPMEGEPGE
jgi:enterochelin esterase family protein